MPVSTNTTKTQFVAGLFGDSDDSSVHGTERIGDCLPHFSAQPRHEQLAGAAQLGVHTLIVEPRQPPVRCAV